MRSPAASAIVVRFLSMQGYYVFRRFTVPGDVRFASEESPGNWESESFGR